MFTDSFCTEDENTSMESVKMTHKRGIVLLFVIVTVASAANEPQFAIRASHPDANGVTFQTAAGTMRNVLG